MATKVERSILVNVPVSTAYNQWTQFEEFPRFMSGIEQVTQLDDRTLHWVAEIAGVRREWDATILEQVPDRTIAWAATEGATNAGAVRFEPTGAGQTTIALTLEYEPEGVVDQIGDRLNLVERRVQGDLERFKEMIEDAGYESGAWRGSVESGAPVGTPGVEDADSSRGDSGKAGISKKAMVAGAAAAAVGVAAAAAVKGGSKDAESSTPENQADVTPVAPVEVPVDALPTVPVDADAAITDDLEPYAAEPGASIDPLHPGGDPDDPARLP